MHNISKDNLCETPKSEIVNTHMYVPVLGSLSILKSYGLYLTVLRKQNRKKKKVSTVSTHHINSFPIRITPFCFFIKPNL